MLFSSKASNVQEPHVQPTVSPLIASVRHTNKKRQRLQALEQKWKRKKQSKMPITVQREASQRANKRTKIRPNISSHANTGWTVVRPKQKSLSTVEGKESKKRKQSTGIRKILRTQTGQDPKMKW